MNFINQGGASKGGNSGPTVQSSLLRIQKEIQQFDKLSSECKIMIPDIQNLYNMKLLITPNEGYWKNITFTFDILLPESYPFEYPQVICDNQVFHPNISPKGEICMAILGKDWNNKLNLSTVFTGLISQFYHPQPHEPLNAQAGQLMMENPDKFNEIIQLTLRGGEYNSQTYSQLISEQEKSQ